MKFILNCVPYHAIKLDNMQLNYIIAVWSKLLYWFRVSLDQRVNLVKVVPLEEMELMGHLAYRDFRYVKYILDERNVFILMFFF